MVWRADITASGSSTTRNTAITTNRGQFLIFDKLGKSILFTWETSSNTTNTTYSLTKLHIFIKFAKNIFVFLLLEIIQKYRNRKQEKILISIKF